LLADFTDILPEAYAARTNRPGIVNAWNDPRFVAAI
jgi:hypothetical protein